MDRRTLLKAAGLAGTTALFPIAGSAAGSRPPATFRFCLNSSTLRGQELGLPGFLEIAARAGYEGVELWIREIEAWRNAGHSLQSLARHLRDAGLQVESAIGFAPCLVPDESRRRGALVQLRQEMQWLAELGCQRIAAPPAGIDRTTSLDFEAMGHAYHDALELGRETGVMPQLEFWGASGTLSQLGQALMVAASANDPDVRLLPDVYHLFRGGSGFEALKMLNGHLIEVFHMNDYPSDNPREQQRDADRVYPGQGGAPMASLIADLRAMGGTKVLSLELFNPLYWSQDALQVASTGLAAMRSCTELA